MRCSATSRRTSSEKCTFTSERGTWPFRNPGRRACFWTRPYARSHSFCTTSTGASTARRRLQPSISSTATFMRDLFPARLDCPGVVREGGVEPPRARAHRILSPARLPVSPLSRRSEAQADDPAYLSTPDVARQPARAHGAGVGGTSLVPSQRSEEAHTHGKFDTRHLARRRRRCADRSAGRCADAGRLRCLQPARGGPGFAGAL